MPWAAQDLPVADVFILARRRRDHAAAEPSTAQRPALMRTAVAQRVERAANIEHPDRAPGDLNDLPASGRDLADCRDRITSPRIAPPRIGIRGCTYKTHLRGFDH